MELRQAVKMYLYSVDLTDASLAWYKQQLGVFVRWVSEHTWIASEIASEIVCTLPLWQTHISKR
jgi:hypothetical protein